MWNVVYSAKHFLLSYYFSCWLLALLFCWKTAHMTRVLFRGRLFTRSLQLWRIYRNLYWQCAAHILSQTPQFFCFLFRLKFCCTQPFLNIFLLNSILPLCLPLWDLIFVYFFLSGQLHSNLRISVDLSYYYISEFFGVFFFYMFFIPFFQNTFFFNFLLLSHTIF